MQSDLIGRRLGPFEIVEYIGTDGLAEIFEGVDPRQDRPVVVKIIGRDLVSDPVFNARFRREARNVANLHHPNIAELIDFGQAEGGHYMVADRVDGISLATVIEEMRSDQRAVEPDDVTFWIRQIAAALDHAHRHGVTHGAVAPDYVVLTRSGQAIVTDFGIALLHSRRTGAEDDAARTTSPYLAPEQIEDARATIPASDVYALGVILYQLLTGEVPFDGNSDIDEALRSLNETAPDPRFLNPHVPGSVALVVLKALAHAPGDRFRNAMRLAEALERAYANPNAGEEILEPRGAKRRASEAEGGSAPAPAFRRPPPTAEERREKKRLRDELERIKQAERAERARMRRAEQKVKRKAFLAKWGRAILVTTISLLLVVALLVVLQTVGIIAVAVKLPSLPTREPEVASTVEATDEPTSTPTPAPSPTVRPTATPLQGASATPNTAVEFAPLQVGSVAFRIVDGQAMVYVPAGPFLMGTNRRDRSESSRPQHTVTLSTYWIDRTEVTNAQYRACVDAGLCPAPANRQYFDNETYANYPVTYVTYEAAAAYCLYIASSTGQVIGLPTEAQWEKAAGWDPANQVQRTYPWGDEPPTPERMRYVESNMTRPAAPVGTHPAGASAYGALDMGGNVWEWVADWFDAESYRRTGVSLDPTGPVSGSTRVTRGGAWTREGRFAVTTVRNPVRPSTTSNEIGFRCAMTADRPPLTSGVVLTPLDLVQSYRALLESARGQDGNDGPTLNEWGTAFDSLEEALTAIDHSTVTELIAERLDRLDTQTENGQISPALALRLRLGMEWIQDQMTGAAP